MLQAKNVTVRYGERAVVNDISFRLEEGQWLMLAGPNGAGKSTLIRALSQGVPHSGEFLLHAKPVRRYRPAQLARQIGVLAQHNHVGYAYTVEEVVSLGRYAYSGSIFSRSDDAGEAHVEEALRLTGMQSFRRTSVLNLSGGELQRVFLAQVFAQNPKILILDEPANHLDLVYQKHIFELIRQWLVQPGRAVLSVVHDLSLARKFGTHALLMDEGREVAQGAAGDVFRPEALQSVYRMDVYGWMRDMLGQWQS